MGLVFYPFGNYSSQDFCHTDNRSGNRRIVRVELDFADE